MLMRDIYSMVNNAGIFLGLANIIDEAVSTYDKTMVSDHQHNLNQAQPGTDMIAKAVNARSVFLGMKYAVAQMMKQEPLSTGERGWIINIASIGGQVGLALERMKLQCLGEQLQFANDGLQRHIARAREL